MSAAPALPRWPLIAWAAAAALVFSASLFVMTGRDDQGTGLPDAAGPSAYSRSSIGHAGFLRLLRRLGIPASASQADSWSKPGQGGVLVVAEPRTDEAGLADAGFLLGEGFDLVLVLPKRGGVPQPSHPGWLAATRLLDVATVARVLALVDADAAVVRPARAPSWTVRELRALPTLPAPQLMVSRKLRPVVAGPDGMLVGQLETDNGRVVVLSDPDVIANHGLGQGDNAALAVEILGLLRGPDGNVVFEETVHGYRERPVSPLALLLQFPWLLLTLQGVLALALLGWSAAGRFGAPEPLPRALPLGSATLIETGARLLDRPAHHALMVRRYLDLTLAELAARLHAPPGLAGAALAAWLDRVAAARGVAAGAAALERRLAAAGDDAASLAAVAAAAFAWRQEILG
ncbi:MAG: DUF4350 domain-containing protein [Dongiaceae bacterium]